MAIGENEVPLELKLYDDPNDPPGFMDSVLACYKEHPEQKQVQALRNILAARPDLYTRVYDLAELTRGDLVGKITSSPGPRLAIKTNIDHMKQELGYDVSPMLERLLIDNLINCWLRYQWVEYHLAEYMGQECTYATIQYWEKRLSLTQARYLRAVETLARVRKLKLPALQVNIAQDGGQQVNIAGDVVKK